MLPRHIIALKAMMCLGQSRQCSRVGEIPCDQFVCQKHRNVQKGSMVCARAHTHTHTQRCVTKPWSGIMDKQTCATQILKSDLDHLRRASTLPQSFRKDITSACLQAITRCTGLRRRTGQSGVCSRATRKTAVSMALALSACCNSSCRPLQAV